MQGLDRRPGRGGALAVAAPTSWRSPTTRPGAALAEVHLTGRGRLHVHGPHAGLGGADRAAAGALKGTGALGPVDAFGLDELVEGCAEAGISEQGAGDTAQRSKQFVG